MLRAEHEGDCPFLVKLKQAQLPVLTQASNQRGEVSEEDLGSGCHSACWDLLTSC